MPVSRVIFGSEGAFILYRYEIQRGPAAEPILLLNMLLRIVEIRNRKHGARTVIRSDWIVRIPSGSSTVLRHHWNFDIDK